MTVQVRLNGFRYFFKFTVGKVDNSIPLSGEIKCNSTSLFIDILIRKNSIEEW